MVLADAGFCTSCILMHGINRGYDRPRKDRSQPQSVTVSFCTDMDDTDVIMFRRLMGPAAAVQAKKPDLAWILLSFLGSFIHRPGCSAWGEALPKMGKA